ncbi:hypothetical protein CC80DRAFT_223096 [Byssothecium circinans]|uniref:Uncharacterized protein n=1 Tax=Byssothecium circinans TaxID=147558 RepID=A0A6A5TDF9_9PLEO|nr:hypothetical protein CC80DRAFT_223096 [Byssothecium circinans]
MYFPFHKPPESLSAYQKTIKTTLTIPRPQERNSPSHHQQTQNQQDMTAVRYPMAKKSTEAPCPLESNSAAAPGSGPAPVSEMRCDYPSSATPWSSDLSA